MKERVRQVEDAQEVSVSADAAESTEPPQEAADEASERTAAEPEATGGERRTHSDDHVEVVERADEGPAAEGGEAADGEAAEEGDDVIVPEQETTTPDAEEPEGDEESDSDIIVA